MKPKLTLELAEIVGIMMGDGSLSLSKNYTYAIRICMNLHKDREYAYFIKKLFKNNSEVVLRECIQEHKNSLILYYLSKSLVNILNNDLLIPLSPKKLVSIPNYIKEDKKLLKSFLKGLFDTDGCVTHQIDKKKGKEYYYVLVKICTKFLHFAEDIKKSLHSLVIPSFICKKKDKSGNIGYDVVV